MNFIDAWDKCEEKKTFPRASKSLRHNSLSPPAPPARPLTPRFLRRERTERGVRTVKGKCQREERRSEVAKHQGEEMKINVEE